MKSTDLIVGESRDLLLQAVLLLRFRRNRVGLYDVSGTLPAVLAEPFIRALDRVEEELEAIDREGADGAMDRTPRQRRADAFVDLIDRVLEVSDPDHSLYT